MWAPITVAECFSDHAMQHSDWSGAGPINSLLPDRYYESASNQPRTLRRSRFHQNSETLHHFDDYRVSRFSVVVYDNSQVFLCLALGASRILSR